MENFEWTEKEVEMMAKGWNKVCLTIGSETLTPAEYCRFNKGDSILGNNANPTTFQTWNPMDPYQMVKAREALRKERCEYTYNEAQGLYHIHEAALEWYQINEYGEFGFGSDLDFAEEL